MLKDRSIKPLSDFFSCSYFVPRFASIVAWGGCMWINKTMVMKYFLLLISELCSGLPNRSKIASFSYFLSLLS